MSPVHLNSPPFSELVSSVSVPDLANKTHPYINTPSLSWNSSVFVAKSQQGGQTNVVISSNASTESSHVSVSEVILLKSTLADELRELYHCLIGGTLLNIVINQCLTVRSPLHYVSDIMGTNIDRKMKPYQSFLLIASSDKIFGVINTLHGTKWQNFDCSPMDSATSLGEIKDSSERTVNYKNDYTTPSNLNSVSGKLSEIIQRCEPFTSFSEIAEQIEEPLSEVITMIS